MRDTYRGAYCMEIEDFIKEIHEIVGRLNSLKSRVQRQPVHYKLREDMMIATVLDTTKILLESLVKNFPDK